MRPRTKRRPARLVSVIRLITVEHTFQRIEVIIGEAVHVVGQQLPRGIFANLFGNPLERAAGAHGENLRLGGAFQIVKAVVGARH